MELTKNMRECLLNELTKAKEDKALQEHCSNIESGKNQNSDWFDIGSFLAHERIKLIEKSLIENEINY